MIIKSDAKAKMVNLALVLAFLPLLILSGPALAQEAEIELLQRPAVATLGRGVAEAIVKGSHVFASSATEEENYLVVSEEVTTNVPADDQAPAVPVGLRVLDK
jgi:hypothetical protein